MAMADQDIIELVVAANNAAPGTALLSDLVAQYEVVHPWPGHRDDAHY